MIGIHWQPPGREGQASGKQQKWIGRLGPPWVRQQGSEQFQQRRTGLHPSAEPLDRLGAMEQLVSIDQHRPSAEVEAALPQLPAQILIAAAITDHQAWQTTPQLAEQGEVTTEGTTPVEHQLRRRGVLGPKGQPGFQP